MIKIRLVTNVLYTNILPRFHVPFLS